MTTDVLIQAAIAMSLICVVAGLLMIPVSQRAARTQQRLDAVYAGTSTAEVSTEERLNGWMRPLGAVGRMVLSSGLLSRKTVGDLEKTMAAAGYRSAPAVSLFVGSKLALLVGLPLFMLTFTNVTGFAPVKPILLVAMSAVVGLLAPDYIVRGVRKRYLKAVEKGLPAALDLLIICAEAGLALEAGFERVAREFEEGIRPTANELRITANEMKVLSDRRQALLNMGTRTGLESMYRLGGMLAQSQKYGTPLSQALRVLAAEMRTMILTQFEARAARLPVLLTIPMILFILPCIFVIVAGPAAVQVMQATR